MCSSDLPREARGAAPAAAVGRGGGPIARSSSREAPPRRGPPPAPRARRPACGGRAGGWGGGRSVPPPPSPSAPRSLRPAPAPPSPPPLAPCARPRASPPPPPPFAAAAPGRVRGRAPGPYRAGADLGAAPSLPAVAVEEEADEAPQAQAPEDEAALQVILLQLAQGGGARSSLVPGGAGAGLEPVLPPPPGVRGRSRTTPPDRLSQRRRGFRAQGGHMYRI